MVTAAMPDAVETLQNAIGGGIYSGAGSAPGITGKSAVNKNKIAAGNAGNGGTGGGQLFGGWGYGGSGGNASMAIAYKRLLLPREISPSTPTSTVSTNSVVAGVGGNDGSGGLGTGKSNGVITRSGGGRAGQAGTALGGGLYAATGNVTVEHKSSVSNNKATAGKGGDIVTVFGVPGNNENETIAAPDQPHGGPFGSFRSHFRGRRRPTTPG